MSMTTKAATYTLPDLLALPDDELNALAAELRGLISEGGWRPSENRNQSGELLAWWVAQSYKAVCIIRNAILRESVRFEWVNEAGDFHNVEIPGISAASETRAFCAAMLAQQGRLKQ